MSALHDSASNTSRVWGKSFDDDSRAITWSHHFTLQSKSLAPLEETSRILRDEIKLGNGCALEAHCE